MKHEFFALYRLPSHTISLTKVASFLSRYGLAFAPKWSGAAYHYDGVEQIVEHRSRASWCTLLELEPRLASGDFGYQTAIIAPYLSNAPLNFGLIELQGRPHVALELGHESLAHVHHELLTRGEGSEALLFGLHQTLAATDSTLGWETSIDTLAAVLAGTINPNRFAELANGSEIRFLLSDAPGLAATMLKERAYRRVSVSGLQPIVSWFPDFPR